MMTLLAIVSALVLLGGFALGWWLLVEGGLELVDNELRELRLDRHWVRRQRQHAELRREIRLDQATLTAELERRFEELDR